MTYAWFTSWEGKTLDSERVVSLERPLTLKGIKHAIFSEGLSPRPRRFYNGVLPGILENNKR